MSEIFDREKIREYKEEQKHQGFWLRAGVAYQGWHDWKEKEPDEPADDDWGSYTILTEFIDMPFKTLEDAVQVAEETFDYEAYFMYRVGSSIVESYKNVQPVYSVVDNRNDTFHNKPIVASPIFKLKSDAVDAADNARHKQMVALAKKMEKLHDHTQVLLDACGEVLVQRVTYNGWQGSDKGRNSHRGSPQLRIATHIMGKERYEKLMTMGKEDDDYRWPFYNSLRWEDYKIGYQGKIAFKQFWEDNATLRKMFDELGIELLTEYDKSRAEKYQEIQQRKNFYEKVREIWSQGIDKIEELKAANGIS